MGSNVLFIKKRTGGFKRSQIRARTDPVEGEKTPLCRRPPGAMKTVCAALVLVMICSLQVASDTQSLNKAHVPSRVVDCCLTYYPHAVPLRSFVSYSIIDSSSCPLKAVVFISKKGMTICGNPAHSWVKRHVAEMDKMQHVTHTLQTTTAAFVPSCVAECCLSYYCLTVPLRSIVSYSISNTSSSCLNAVVFKTNKGVHYCVDPSVKWVKRYVAALDHRQVTNVTMVDQTTL
ncbi:uncharacterized protein LOC107654095 [Arapaima gigas]